MRASRPLGAVLLACAALAALAAPAAAVKLSFERAEKRSLDFAERTCARDKHCVDFGVLNCRRHAPKVILCRVFDERRTRIQGRYRCERLVRMSLDPRTLRLPVTGLGDWHC
jgi:hypothetical protein